MLIFAIAVTTTGTLTAQAAEDCADQYFLSLKLESKCEKRHYIPVGAGVSSPSVGATYIENPAGFIYNNQLKLHGSVSQTNGGSTRYGLNILNGTGTIGGGLGLSRYPHDPGNNSAANALTFGSGGFWEGLKVAFGASFAVATANADEIISSRDGNYISSNIGILVNPKGNWRFGGTLYNVFKGYKGYGLGVTGSPAKNAVVSLDGIWNANSDLTIVKAAFGTSFSSFVLSAGYGAQFQSQTAGLNLPDGVSFSIAWMASSWFRASFAFNHVDFLYLAGTLAF